MNENDYTVNMYFTFELFQVFSSSYSYYEAAQWLFNGKSKVKGIGQFILWQLYAHGCLDTCAELIHTKSNIEFKKRSIFFIAVMFSEDIATMTQ